MEKKYLTDNIYWSSEGLYVQNRKNNKKVSNAVPVVENVYEIINVKNTEKEIRMEISYQYAGEIEDETIVEFSETEIKSGKFFDKRPIKVIVEPTFSKKIREIYQCIIQKQMLEKTPIKKEKFTFGWNGKKFSWENNQRKENLKKDEYKVATYLAECLQEEEMKGMSMLLLASVHGPLKYVLNEVGIKHDFVTYIVGSTGVGKTEMACRMCNYVSNKTILYSLASDKKELRKMIQNSGDITIVIDDYNKSSSNRVIERQKQVLSEIIQAASDSGKLLVDETSIEHSNGYVHLVVTGEEIIKNVSTLNRCFLVKIEETLSEDGWKRLEIFSNKMECFMYSFLSYIEERYDEIKKRIGADYKIYLEKSKRNCKTGDNSNMRIAYTLAIQLLLKKLIIDYFKYLQIDDKLIEKVDCKMERFIGGCTAELCTYINQMVKSEQCMKYLPDLAFVISQAFHGHGYYFAKTEKEYKKKRELLTEDGKCIGMLQEDEYISFSPSYMCKIIEENMEEALPVSIVMLGKELGNYNLARVDIEGKTSCKWHTQSRMYHVNVKALYEIVNMHLGYESYWYDKTLEW